MQCSHQQVIWIRKVLKTTWTNLRSYTAKPVKPKKPKAEGNTAEDFVDFKKVRVIGGRGGNGLVSFLRVMYNEFAGPDGGDGGNGGHVIFTAKRDVSSLNHIKSHQLCAPSGVNGRSTMRHGKNAEHLIIKVPLGTIVRDIEGKLLTNLDDESDYYIAARGGAGGHGNHFFVSSTDTTPRFAEEGAQGEDRELCLELRIMAHVGLIGFPNAGKSTLLRAISRARPKVSPYPFTTTHPHVGMVQYDDQEQVAVADIPGIVPGAHKNEGLGIAFLRHIERCACLLYVIDVSEPEPWTQLECLMYELEQYRPGLSKRPCAVVANKMDLPEARENYKQLEKHTELRMYPVSAMNQMNLSPVLLYLRVMYDTFGSNLGLGR